MSLTKYHSLLNGSLAIIDMTETEKMKMKAYKYADLKKGMLVYDSNNGYGDIYEIISIINKDRILVSNDEGRTTISFFEDNYYPVILKDLDEKELSNACEGFDKLRQLEDILNNLF